MNRISSGFIAGLPILLALLTLASIASGANTLTITVLGSTFNTTGGTATVTATPAMNSLIVVVGVESGIITVTAAAVSDNAPGGTTYDPVSATAIQGASTARVSIYTRMALMPIATSTIFTWVGGASTGGGLLVYQVTGAGVRSTNAEAVQSAAQNNIASGTPAPVFTYTPIAQDAIVAAVINAANPATMTPRTGYTEDVDTGWATPTMGVEAMHLNSGETSSTITWGSSSASAFGSVAIELYVLQSSFPSLIASASESPGVNCAAGGYKFTYGLDNGDGGGTALNGVLEAGEVDTTVYVCNGAAGAAGVNGFNSLLSVATASESPGANCANGGTKVTMTSGLDNGDGGGTARDGILQAGEIDQTTIFYSCTGATGATGSAGTNGFNTLVVTSAAVESPGANCANGGTKITMNSGLDNGDGGGTARDGILQVGEYDVTTIFFSCKGDVGATGATGATGPTGPAGVDGYNSLILTVSESPGVNCLVGGIKITTGLDNGDGGGTPRDSVLQSGEVDAGPYYVCNGSAGLTGPTGPQGPPGPQGSPGVNSLVATAPESAGVNCANSGIKVTHGLDNGDGGGIANDGILQSGEVDGTSYVCNGAPSLNGTNGKNAVVASSPEPFGSPNCPNGGVNITSGTDTNGNGTLEASEITDISYACNAAPVGSAATWDWSSSAGTLVLLLIIFAILFVLGFKVPLFHIIAAVVFVFIVVDAWAMNQDPIVSILLGAVAVFTFLLAFRSAGDDDE